MCAPTHSALPFPEPVLGAETFLTAMINRLEIDLAMSTSSLHCMRLDSTLRKRAAEALVPATKMKVNVCLMYQDVLVDMEVL